MNYRAVGGITSSMEDRDMRKKLMTWVTVAQKENETYLR